MKSILILIPLTTTNNIICTSNLYSSLPHWQPVPIIYMLVICIHPYLNGNQHQYYIYWQLVFIPTSLTASTNIIHAGNLYSSWPQWQPAPMLCVLVICIYPDPWQPEIWSDTSIVSSHHMNRQLCSKKNCIFDPVCKDKNIVSTTCIIMSRPTVTAIQIHYQLQQLFQLVSGEFSPKHYFWMAVVHFQYIKERSVCWLFNFDVKNK